MNDATGTCKEHIKYMGIDFTHPFEPCSEYSTGHYIMMGISSCKIKNIDDDRSEGIDPEIIYGRFKEIEVVCEGFESAMRRSLENNGFVLPEDLKYDDMKKIFYLNYKGPIDVLDAGLLPPLFSIFLTYLKETKPWIEDNGHLIERDKVLYDMHNKRKKG